jgi:parallel beta-helix repeat protein
LTKKKLLSISLLLIMISLVFSAQNSFQLAEANFFPMQVPQPAITINEDGTISPAYAPIVQSGNIYTLTEDITGNSIVIDRDNIVLDGANYTLHGNGNLAGVFIQDQNNVKIQNLNIQNFTYGILFTWLYNYGASEPKTNTVNNNTLTGNTYGLYFNDFSQSNIISANTVKNNLYGIYLGSSSNNVLKNNHMSNNTFNFFVSGYSSSAINDVDTSNKVEGKPIIYWINEQNKQVPSDAGYIALVNCKEIIIQNFDLRHNGQAILIAGVSNSTVINNTLAENDNALWIVNSNDIAITQNTFLTNTKDSLYIVSSNATTITGNLFIDGGYNGSASEQTLSNLGQAAVRITSSSNNAISNNTFLNNGEGISLSSCSSHLITENYLDSNTGTTIYLYSCTQNSIIRNTISNGGGVGVKVWNSENNIIKSNLLTNNVLGILLDAASNNYILENTIANNTDWGMQLKSTSDDFMSSTNNTILRNNFINNQQSDGLDVSIPGVWVMLGGYIAGLGNIWDDGYEGNFWGDYKIRYPNTSEVPGAGIWDQAWVINENNIDHCPLILPYQNSLQQLTPTPTVSAVPTIEPSTSAQPHQSPNTSLPSNSQSTSQQPIQPSEPYMAPDSALVFASVIIIIIITTAIIATALRQKRA